LFEVEPMTTAHLWEGMGIHLAVQSILACRTEARMLVDDASAPRGAVTWTGHRLYLAGDIDEGFADAVEEFAGTRRHFVAYPTPEAFGGAEKLLSGYGAEPKGRLYYEGNPTTKEWVVNPPAGYSVERITEELLSRGLIHADWVKGEMCSERESVEEFIAKSFGFAAVNGGRIACWCTSEYNLSDRCEVGIETAPEDRRRGLATMVASAMFRHAASVGVRRIGWHCRSDNAASAATAEKLGLRRTAEYTVLASG